MKRSLVAMLTIGFTVASLAALALVFSLIKEPPPDVAAIHRLFTVSPRDFAPEPRERWVYVISVIALPLLSAGLDYLFATRRLTIPRSSRLKARAIMLLAVLLLFFVAYMGLKRAEFSYLGSSSLVQRPLPTVFIIAVLAVAVIGVESINFGTNGFLKAALSSVCFGLGIIIVVLISLEAVFGDTEPNIMLFSSWEHLHFAAYFDSVAQVYLGKVPLVNINPQYGLYSIFLKPIFELTGLTVPTFTIVLAALKAIAYASLLVFLLKTTENRLLGLIGFLAIAFYTRMRVPLDVIVDPYFQYDPQRMLFPAIFVGLLPFYLAGKNPRGRGVLFLLISLTGAISLPWSPDTGTMVLAAWILTLAYEQVSAFGLRSLLRAALPFAKRAGVVVAVTACVTLAFAVYARAAAGGWPHFGSAALYTRMFYFYGFYMLPMPALHPWNVIVLIYAVGLYFSIDDLVRGQDTTLPQAGPVKDPGDRHAVLFALSVLGLGLFTYYQGRSHDWNLISVSWPALLLMTIFADMLLRGLSSTFLRKTTISWKMKSSILVRRSYEVVLFVGMFSLLGSAVPSMALNYPAYRDIIIERLRSTAQHNTLLASETTYIQSTARSEDPILILSDTATELYLYTKHPRPVDVPGFSELVMRSDVAKIKSFLSDPPKTAKIYWSPDFHTIDPRVFRSLSAVSMSPDLILYEPADR